MHGLHVFILKLLLLEYYWHRWNLHESVSPQRIPRGSRYGRYKINSKHGPHFQFTQ
jgi:hypothetical protein